MSAWHRVSGAPPPACAGDPECAASERGYGGSASGAQSRARGTPWVCWHALLFARAVYQAPTGQPACELRRAFSRALLLGLSALCCLFAVPRHGKTLRARGPAKVGMLGTWTTRPTAYSQPGHGTADPRVCAWYALHAGQLWRATLACSAQAMPIWYTLAASAQGNRQRSLREPPLRTAAHLTPPSVKAVGGTAHARRRS